MQNEIISRSEFDLEQAILVGEPNSIRVLAKSFFWSSEFARMDGDEKAYNDFLALTDKAERAAFSLEAQA